MYSFSYSNNLLNEASLLFQYLPLWFKIFSFLSVTDLYSASSVCRVWYDVISSVFFLDKNGPWKFERSSVENQVDCSRLFPLLGNVSNLTLDLSLVKDLYPLRSLWRLTNLCVYGAGQHSTEAIATTLKCILQQVKDFSSHAIQFNREEQVFLSFIFFFFCPTPDLLNCMVLNH